MTLVKKYTANTTQELYELHELVNDAVSVWCNKYGYTASITISNIDGEQPFLKVTVSDNPIICNLINDEKSKNC